MRRKKKIAEKELFGNKIEDNKIFNDDIHLLTIDQFNNRKNILTFGPDKQIFYFFVYFSAASFYILWLSGEFFYSNHFELIHRKKKMQFHTHFLRRKKNERAIKNESDETFNGKKMDFSAVIHCYL